MSGPPRPARRVRPGSKVGRYIIVRELGAGGMGVVYEAYDTKLDRRAALEMLHAWDERDLGSTRQRKLALRLLREGRALAQLSSVNVPAVYDVGIHDDYPFIATELINGPSLAQWLRARSRPWAQVLEVLLEAGAGLADAHAAGLVHRDFKPDNILLGKDGPVRVVDFGLAGMMAPGQAGATRDIEENDTTTWVVPVQQGPAGQELTRAGTVMGTPSYMAPEQYRGEASDHLSDQFAFCVTLYEALYRQKPFGPANDPDFARRLGQGELVGGHNSRRVPAGLGRLIRRGLAVRPHDRFPSMAHLLAALEEARARHRRRQLTGFALPLAASAALAMTQLAPSPESEPCPSAQARWQGIWDNPRRSEIATAFSALDAHWAHETHERIGVLFDERMKSWLDVHDQVCRETRIQGTADDADMDIRMTCLRLDLSRYRVLSDQLAQVDTGLARQAVRTLYELPHVHACRDAPGLRDALPWPKDQQLRREVESLRRNIDEVRVLGRSGRWSDACALATDLEHNNRDLDFAAAQAELQGWLGAACSRGGDEARYVEHIERSLEMALSARHHRAAAVAGIELLYAKSYMQADPTIADGLISAAYARVRAAGSPPELEAELLQMHAFVLGMRGENAKSMALMRRALARSHQAYGPSHPSAAFLIGNLAVGYKFTGRLRDAQREVERAIAMMEATLGGSHPSIAHWLGIHSEVVSQLGDPRRARDISLRAIEVCESANGNAAPGCLPFRAWGSESHLELGLYHQTLELIEPLRINQAQTGRRGHPYVPWTQAIAAQALLGLGRVDAARERADEAFAKLDAETHAFPFIRARALRIRAQAERATGQPATAIASLKQANSELAEQTLDSEFERIAILTELGLSKAQLGEGHEGLLDLRQALAMAQGRGGADNPAHAGIHGHLSDLLYSLGYADSARTHAETAAGLRLRAVGQGHSSLVDYRFRLAELDRDADRQSSADQQHPGAGGTVPHDEIHDPSGVNRRLGQFSSGTR